MEISAGKYLSGQSKIFADGQCSRLCIAPPFFFQVIILGKKAKEVIEGYVAHCEG